MNNKELPLVSIVVITYNSSKYVLETLESIKAQTYQNIELIISDDCSTDNTFEICKEWLLINKSRFKKAELVTTSRNGGIAANVNNAIKYCKGTWIKNIAGDDILFNTCIDDYILFIKQNPHAQFITAKMKSYKNEFLSDNLLPSTYRNDELNFYTLNAKEQLHYIILNENIIPAPAVLINRELLYKIGLYDERYFIEDFPTWIKILKTGEKCFYLNKETIGYRVCESSTHPSKSFINFRFRKGLYLIKKDLCFEYYTKKQIIREYLAYGFCALFQNMGLNNRSNLFSKIVYNGYAWLIKHI